jgi:hypothetical protein
MDSPTSTVGHSSSREISVIISSVVCLVAAVAVVALRCYVRLFIIKRFAGDDWFAVGTLVRHNSFHLEAIIRNMTDACIS